MKKLILVIMLVSFPWVSQAKDWKKYNRYDNHYSQDKHYNHKQQNDYSFWKKVDHRQHSLALQIKEGIYEGLLTKSEIYELKHQQKRVAKQIRYFKKNHHLRYADKQIVMDCLDEVSDKIMYLKQNKYYAHNRHNTYYDHNRYASSLSYHGKPFHHDASIGFHFRF